MIRIEVLLAALTFWLWFAAALKYFLGSIL